MTRAYRTKVSSGAVMWVRVCPQCKGFGYVSDYSACDRCGGVGHLLLDPLEQTERLIDAVTAVGASFDKLASLLAAQNTPKQETPTERTPL